MDAQEGEGVSFQGLVGLVIADRSYNIRRQTGKSDSEHDIFASGHILYARSF